MFTRFAVLAALSLLLGCGAEQLRDTQEISQTSEDAAEEVDSLRVVLNRARLAWGEVDTAEVHMHLDRFIKLIRVNPDSFEFDRIEAAKTFSWLRDGESAIQILKQGVDHEPELAQFVGHALLYHGENEAARMWYRRAFEHTGRLDRSEMEVSNPDAELFTGSWLSLLWLAYDREVALDSLANLPATLREPYQVQLIACYVRFAEPIDWVRAFWEDVTEASSHPEPYEQCMTDLR